jgi:hypothetical protein
MKMTVLGIDLTQNVGSVGIELIAPVSPLVFMESTEGEQLR